MSSRLNELALAKAAREKEALKVYRPQEVQQDFHRSPATERVVRGGKRSGKSISVAMEFGSIVTGTPIIGLDGKPIHQHRPSPNANYPRIYWIIGWGVSHIGQTIHKLLFQPGMGGTLRVIKDRHSNQWRIWDRTNPDDIARQNESEPAGPIIPERLIKPNSWVWNSSGGGAAGNCFESVELKNGAKIFAYPSSARQAKQGDAVSGIWIDEDIQIPEHLTEWQDRLGDENGWLMWSVWPHTKNSALIDLLDRAFEDMENPPEERRVEQFQLIFSQNKFITESAKDAQLARMGDEESIARRDRGELLLDQLAMYNYSKGIHLIEPMPVSELARKPESPVDYLRGLLSKLGTFPREWTRYLSVDPSHTRTACLSYVVPPQEIDGYFFGDLAIVEWELVSRQASATILASMLREKMQGRNYEAFIMDRQMGSQTRVGEDNTVFDAYSKAFRVEGLVSRQTLSGFIPGCNVPQTRYRAVRDALATTTGRHPMLLLVSHTTAATQREFQTYRKKQQNIGGEVTIIDEPSNPRKHDCMASLEYGITHLMMLFQTGGAYVPPTAYRGKGSPAYQAAMKLKQQQARAVPQTVHYGPGSSPRALVTA